MAEKNHCFLCSLRKVNKSILQVFNFFFWIGIACFAIFSFFISLIFLATEFKDTSKEIIKFALYSFRAWWLIVIILAGIILLLYILCIILNYYYPKMKKEQEKRKDEFFMGMKKVFEESKHGRSANRRITKNRR